MTDFDKPLNTWIEEEIEIPTFKPEVNEKEKRVEIKQTTQKATRKTYYAQSTPQRVVCNDHKYFCQDKGRYLFKCVKCDWSRFAYPHTFKFNPDTGKLIHRITGQQA